MQYPHTSSLIATSFIQTLQYPHIRSHHSGWFFTFIAIPHMGPIIVDGFLHSLQYPHIGSHNNRWFFIFIAKPAFCHKLKFGIIINLGMLKKHILGTQTTY
jgi:hypothetical protein